MTSPTMTQITSAKQRLLLQFVAYLLCQSRIAQRKETTKVNCRSSRFSEPLRF